MIKRFFIFLFIYVCEIAASQNPVSDSLKKLLAKTEADTQKVNILLQLIEHEEDDAIWPSFNRTAMALTDKLLSHSNPQIAKTALRQKTGCLINLAYLHQVKSNYDSALIIYNNALAISNEINDVQSKGTIYNNAGGIYYFLGNNVMALKNYSAALDLAEKTGNVHMTATLLNNIGNIHSSQKEADKAIEYFRKGLIIRSQTGDLTEMMRIYNNIGLEYLQQAQYDSALSNYDKGISLLSKKNDKLIAAALFHGKAEIYRAKKDMENYHVFLIKAIRYRKETQIPYQDAKADADLGHYYFISHAFDSAIYYFEKSYKTAESLNIASLIKNASANLHEIYSQKKQFEKAYKYLLINKKISDQTLNSETQKAALHQAMKYEYEKKEAIAKAEQEKKEVIAIEEKRKQNIILSSVTGILIIVFAFSIFLYRGFVQKKKANIAISSQKAVIEEKQKEILDSIHYARRIQSALLANKEFLDQHIPANLIFFKPKDIVSGDFYWAAEHNGYFYIAACDSTGHGVPGAFMSLLNIGFLSEAIKEKNIAKPNEILDYVRSRLIGSISNEGQKDGMDGILLCLNSITGEITYAAAHNKPVLISGNALHILEADKMPVGKGEKVQAFQLFNINAKQGDSLYLFTDGFADQFGGPKGKKFKYKQLEELLLKIYSLPFGQQSEELNKTFESWKGDLEQVDDVLLIGIKL